MKTTYALSSELNAAVAAVNAAISKRTNFDSVINALPATIGALEEDAARLAKEFSTVEAQLALSLGAQTKRLEAACSMSSESLSSAEIAVKRAKARVVALEAMAPEIDEAVQTAGTILNQEVQIASDALRSMISDELQTAIQPVLGVLAKAHSADFGQLRDFLAGAFLPDPAAFMMMHSGSDFVGTNLLRDVSTTPESEALAATLAPVRKAMVAVRTYQPYTPLANRAKPYVLKGYSHGGRPAPAHTSQAQAQPTAGTKFPRSEYRSFDLESGQPAEVNQGLAMADALLTPAYDTVQR